MSTSSVVTGLVGLSLLWIQTQASIGLAVEPDGTRIPLGAIMPACTYPSFTISADGSLLATEYSSNRTIAVWDISKSRLLSVLTPATSDVERTLAFSSNNRTLFVSEAGTAVSLWDVNTGKRRGVVGTPSRQRLHSFPFTVAQNGKLIALADNEAHILLVYDIEPLRIKTQIRLDNDRYISDLRFSSDDTVVVGLNQAGVVEGWNPEDGKSVYRTDFSRHLKDKVEAPDTKEDGVVRFSRGSQYHSKHVGPELRGSLSNDGASVVLWRSLGSIGVYSTKSAKEVLRYEVQKEISSAASIALSARGEIAAVPVEQEGGVIRLIRIPSGEKLGEVTLPHQHVQQILFSQDGRYLAVATQFRVRLFAVSTLTELPATQGEETWWRAAFSDNNDVLLLQGISAISARDLRNGKQRWSAVGESVFAFWADDLLGVVQANGELVLRNGETGEVKRRINLPTWDGKTARKYFHPQHGEVALSESLVMASFIDSDLLYLIADRQIAVYSLENGKTRFLPVENSLVIQSAQFMPDDISRLLVVQSKKDDAFGAASQIAIVDSKSGKVLHAIQLSGDIHGAISSPDGKYLVAIATSPSEKGPRSVTKVTCWEVGKEKPIGSTEHSGWTLDASIKGRELPARFSPDGRQLLVGDRNGRIHVIETSKFNEVAVRDVHAGAISSLSLSRHKMSVLSTALDGACLQKVSHVVGE